MKKIKINNLFIFSLVFSIFLSFFITPFSFAVESDRPQPLEMTSILALKYIKDGKTIRNDVITNTWYSLVFGDKSPLNKNPNSVGGPENFKTLKNSFDKILETGKGSYGIYQYEYNSGSSISHNLALFFTNSDSPVTLYSNVSGSSSGYRFALKDPDARFYSMRLEAYNNDVYHTVTIHNKLSLDSSHVIYLTPINYGRLFLFNGNLTIDESIKDLVGSVPSSVDEQYLKPLFMYKLKELNFNGFFVGFSDGSRGDEDRQRNLWRWRVYNTKDTEFTKGDELFSYTTHDIFEPFNYDFDIYGDYIITVDLYTPAPFVPDERIKPTHFEFKLNVKIGGDVTGENLLPDCRDGVCPPVKQNCHNIKSPHSKLLCTLRENFDFGFFNPMITAVSNLFNSFIVKRPDCRINLINPSISGKEFNLSNFSKDVCYNANQFHKTFPAVSVIVNFFFVIVVLRMLANMFNRFTNKFKNDVVEVL